MKKLFCAFAAAIALCMPLALSACDTGGSRIDYDDADRYSVGNGQTASAVTELDLEWIAGEIEVKYGDTAQVVFSETTKSEIAEEERMRYWLDGSILRIRFAKSGSKLNGNLKKSLTVELPAATALTEFDADTVSANVMASVASKEINMDSVSGNIDLVSLTAGADIDVETVSGAVNLTVDDGSSLQLESVSGNMTVLLPEAVGYRLTFDSVSGTCTKTDVSPVTSGGVLVKADTVSGNLYLRKK